MEKTELNNNETHENKNSLARKFRKVMMECSKFNQSGKHEHFGYKYSTISDILSKMNEVLTKYGIISTIHSKLVEIKEFKNAKGYTDLLVVVEIENILTDVETNETLSIISLGCGSDTTKAQVNAIKYGYVLSCCSSSTLGN